MTKSAKFVDFFWEHDYIGTTGFECLCRLMKDGRTMCREVEEYFKQRAKAEANYCKALQSIFRSSEEKNGGTLSSAWQEVKHQTLKQANIHEEARETFQKILDDLSKFTEDQKQQTRSFEDRVKKSQTNKKSLYNRTLDLEKAYSVKCRDLDQAIAQLEQMSNSVTVTQKDVDRAKAKADKSRENMEQADIAYKTSLEHLERARQTWEVDMREACNGFQNLEEVRLFYLRDELWKGSNVDSQMCVDIDKSSEKIRCRLEGCDPGKDIEDFIGLNKTGSNPPSEIQYRSHFDERSHKKDENKRERPPQPTPQTAGRGRRGGREGMLHMVVLTRFYRQMSVYKPNTRTPAYPADSKLPSESSVNRLVLSTRRQRINRYHVLVCGTTGPLYKLFGK
ncbi:hypothetical protein ScPMuIL_017158 [Solemya velum]